MKFWTVNELAEKYQVDRSTIRDWIRKKLFPNAFKKPGIKQNFWVVPESDLKNFTRPKRGGRFIANPSRRTLNSRKWTYRGEAGYRPLSELEISEIIAFYQNGNSQAEATFKFRIPLYRVKKIMKDAGVKPRRRTVSKTYLKKIKEKQKIVPKELIIELYLEKRLRLDEIFARLGVSHKTFYKLLKSYGIEKRGVHAKS